MNLGKKLRQARLEAGLSQRQLCGEEITRNMLSQIENGSAQPSMKTLRYLAGQLGKSVSFFLEDPNEGSPNLSALSAARLHHDLGQWNDALEALNRYSAPDPLFDREWAILWALTHLSLAEQAIAQGRFPYALELLEKGNVPIPYFQEAFSRSRLLLLGRIPGQLAADALPPLDGELLLRAREALTQGNSTRCSQLLSAVEEKSTPQYHQLQGELSLREKQYRQAAAHFLQAGDLEKNAPNLEQCYRELGDYKRAYEFACMQK